MNQNQQLFFTFLIVILFMQEDVCSKVTWTFGGRHTYTTTCFGCSLSSLATADPSAYLIWQGFYISHAPPAALSPKNYNPIQLNIPDDVFVENIIES